MSRSSGSTIAAELVEKIAEVVEDKLLRETLYVQIIETFEDHDCDTLDEILDIDPLFAKIYSEMHDYDISDMFPDQED